MSYQIVKNQIQAANENLAQINAPYRIGYMSQNNHTRITLEIGTPEQISKGCAKNSLLPYATQNECSKFLTGFNAALAMLSNYSAPVNQK